MSAADDTASRHGRADLHIHTAASDGTAPVTAILERVAARGDLDVIAIADHDRIDAALAARAMAHDRAYPFEVVVGEEVSTRGGHLLGLFLTGPLKPWRSMRATIAEVHAQGGVAVPAHPFIPYPLCVSRRTLLRLLADPDPATRPDALEVFNPTTIGRRWHPAVVAFAAEHGLPGIGDSDAHELDQIGQGWTGFPGRSADDLRRAIAAGTTTWHGDFYPRFAQVGMVGRQYRKKARDLSADLGGRLLRRGTGRDLGYPGGRQRPASYRADGEEARP
ncbi:MAG TPA: PHP domain-containing protein [Candidatus Sulfotelmatobacter sp.]|nr:PHP domain-containing protein [Candidatus Sulfotelmatobacter sp.]